MGFLKRNFLPFALALLVTGGLLLVVGYISYSIEIYKPEAVIRKSPIRGWIEPEQFVARAETVTLDEFYQPPGVDKTPPVIEIGNLEMQDDAELLQWLGFESK